MRIVDAGVELPGRAAPADELCCCCWHGRVARARLLHHSNPSIALTPALADSFRLCEAAAPMAGENKSRDVRRANAAKGR